MRELRGGRRRVAGWLPLPALLHRLASSELVGGMQLAASGGGGGRGLGVAAVVGVAAALGPAGPPPDHGSPPVARTAAVHPRRAPHARPARVPAHPPAPAGVRVAAVARRAERWPARPEPRSGPAAWRASAPAPELTFERVASPALEPAAVPARRRRAAEPSQGSTFEQGEFAP